MLSVNVDATGFQEADNGDTTYYGGEIFITNDTNVDIVINCKGNDRGDDEVYWPTLEAILRGLQFSREGDEWDEFVSDVLDEQTEFYAAIRCCREFKVYRDGDKLLIENETGEKVEMPINA